MWVKSQTYSVDFEQFYLRALSKSLSRMSAAPASDVTDGLNWVKRRFDYYEKITGLYTFSAKSFSAIRTTHTPELDMAWSGE